MAMIVPGTTLSLVATPGVIAAMLVVAPPMIIVVSVVEETLAVAAVAVVVLAAMTPTLWIHMVMIVPGTTLRLVATAGGIVVMRGAVQRMKSAACVVVDCKGV